MMVLSGCGHQNTKEAFNKAGPGTAVVAQEFQVKTSHAWSGRALHKPILSLGRDIGPFAGWTEYIRNRSESWSDKGYSLNQITFVSGIKSGESPFLSVGVEPAPIYRRDMINKEIQNLFFKRLGLKTHEGAGNVLTPISVGGRHGFMAPFAFQATSRWWVEYGVRYRGLFYAFRDADTLSVIYFLAPELHYFDAYLPHFQEIIGALRFVANRK